MYFLPVIIATGVVIELIMRCTNPSLAGEAGVAQNQKSDMIDVTEILSWINLEGTFAKYFQMAISQIFNLVWKSGVQIVLFIAGMQAIPDSLYEVSRVEGATKWEEFWFITIPMLSRIIVLVTVFTMVELINDKTNAVMSYIYTLMSTLQYSLSSAMLWIYFAISGIFIALVMGLFTKFCVKRWE
jgi:ABC-type sugar transport system permease subunit